MKWEGLPYDRPIRFGMAQCRAFITAERDGNSRRANVAHPGLITKESHSQLAPIRRPSV